jgi:hypothetical protein
MADDDDAPVAEMKDKEAVAAISYKFDDARDIAKGHYDKCKHPAIENNAFGEYDKEGKEMHHDLKEIARSIRNWSDFTHQYAVGLRHSVKGYGGTDANNAAKLKHDQEKKDEASEPHVASF